jgi:hypothetical protein
MVPGPFHFSLFWGYLCHLGGELSILRCRKCFRGFNYPYKKKENYSGKQGFIHIYPQHEFDMGRGISPINLFFGEKKFLV